MQTNEGSSTGNYPAHGLIANPFATSDAYRAGSKGVKLAAQASVMRLLKQVKIAADGADRKPVVVEKASSIPGFYPVSALAGLFDAIEQGTPVAGIVQAYIPLDMMKLGRVRATLGIIAERVAGNHVDLTLAAWSRVALTEPDTACAEWVVLGGADIAGIVAEIDADPQGFSDRVFGELVYSREGAQDLEMLMRVSTARQRLLETDPTEGEPGESLSDVALDEQALDDPMAEAFVTPLDDGSDSMALEAESEGPSQDELLFDYVVAYTRERLSPVVARGIRAYKAQGMLSMTQEFKVTKAPTKTLAALLKFAECRMSIGLLIFDGFAMWSSVPADLRMKIIATLQQLRWALKDEALLVLMLEPGQAPEVDESFAAATRVAWDFHELTAVESRDALFDGEVAREWALASSDGESVPEWLDALITAVPEGATFEVALPVLGTLVAEYVASGTAPGADAVAQGMDAATAESPA